MRIKRIVMKRILAFLTAALALMAISSCEETGKDEPDDDKLEVNEANLSGTWEGGVEHDFGQGYPQKWRIQFDGKDYTTWHTHQTLGTTNDEVQGLKTVGNKEKGTWEYANGVLTLTPKEQYASYYQVMKPDYTLGGNVYYQYNEDTMEAVQWYETPQSLIEDGIQRDLQAGEGAMTWTISNWKIVSLTKTALTLKINMDTFELTKK